ncbi:TPA: hypothetical protein RFK34_001704 [Listeria monocytogenes]|nr:hypothetical protein [Listeria monocytogenes]
MERYIQITNEAAAQMILEGNYNNLWFKNGYDIGKCTDYVIHLKQLRHAKFFVKISTDTEEMSE